jgi:hypothetical protein
MSCDMAKNAAVLAVSGSGRPLSGAGTSMRQGEVVVACWRWSEAMDGSKGTGQLLRGVRFGPLSLVMSNEHWHTVGM